MAGHRILAGLISSASGTVGVLGLVISMNAMDRSPPTPPVGATATFDVPKIKKKPPTRKPRPRRPPPKAQRNPPPIPSLGSAVGGLELGVFGAAAIDLSEGVGALVGGADDVVMTADSVDSLCQPTQRSAMAYPAQARSRGITGHVTLSLSCDARGQLTDVGVVDVQPAGYAPFEQAAVQTVRSWRFSAATYQGAPVPVSGVEITIRFDLEQR